jgi:YrbI family 3-deoxy-D-manno-octulosonate 8-phosphate phosphatase
MPKPKNKPPRNLRKIRMVVLDFDGVLTDDLVYVSEDGHETVQCSRSDGMGLELLRKKGFIIAVISKEPNPVVSMRCAKLKVPCYQGIEEKYETFQRIVAEQNLKMDQVLYIGNDINDLECMQTAGISAAPADAHGEALAIADWILSKPGGKGAVRQLCDALLDSLRRSRNTRRN